MVFHGLLRNIAARLRARRRMGRRVRLWYHPSYAAGLSLPTERTPTLQADRGEAVVRQLLHAGLCRADDIAASEPASFSLLARVHLRRYLDQSAEAETLARIFAVDAGQIDSEALLDGQRRQVQATVDAAQWAVAGAQRVGVNLGGGFHHAGPESGGGFCVYNDLAVAIAALRLSGYRAPIAIVDLDFHQGDGTAQFYENDPTVLTYSLHGAEWSHAQAPTTANAQLRLPLATGDDGYLAALHQHLVPALQRHRPGLLFYVAGGDVLADDPLGGFGLSEAGVLLRDQLVLGWAQAHGASAVVTFGGGYLVTTWRIWVRLVAWLLCGDAPPLELFEEVSSLHARFNSAASRLDPLLLQTGAQGDDWGIDEDEVMLELTGKQTASKFLGYYTAQGIELALEHYGIIETLRARGFVDLTTRCELSEPHRQRAQLWGRRQAEALQLLVELVARRQSATLPDDVRGALPAKIEVMFVEWLLAQDPTAEFNLSHPRLPGQQHPGIGMARQFLELLYQVAARVGLAAVVVHPAHFHVAAGAQPAMRFLDPRAQGRFDALRAACAALNLCEASWAVERGLVLFDDAPLRWRAEPLALPVAAELEGYFASDSYAQARRDERQRWPAERFTVAGDGLVVEVGVGDVVGP